MSAPETATQGAVPESGLTIRIEAFEGPLDLLLHLCRTSEVDVSRLRLRAITDQYLAHLEAVRFQDLETAGSFMVMAATLIYLKSKLLLPVNPDDQDETLDEEGELLKRELEERLREYARVKALGAWLAEREAQQALIFSRTTAELPPPEDIPLEDLSVHLLQRALQRIIEEQKRRAPRQVEPNPISVLERMNEILELLRSTWSLLFSSVAGGERLRAYYLHNGLGNPFDTAVAAARLIFGGVLDRFPRLQVCLAHAGGALPFLIGRLDRVHRVRTEARERLRRPPTAYLRRLYFDTITHHGPALEYLVGLVGADRVVLGSDYRFDMGMSDPAGAVRAVRRLTRTDRSAILGGVAAKLLKL